MQRMPSLPGHYDIQDILGQDCYTLTYKATDRCDGSEVVLKALRPLDWLSSEEASARNARVQTRLSLLPSIDCPALSRQREIIVTSNSVVAVRDYVRGASLRSVLNGSGQVSLESALRIADQVGQALDSLAPFGVFHGAVTPENVLLADNGSVLLADPLFRAESRALLIAGVSCKSVERQDYRNDAEALAGLLFEALTGVPATRDLASTIKQSYQLSPQTRFVLSRALSGARSPFSRAGDLACSLAPASRPSLFQAVWRPAAATGLLGALVTLGGYAYSERTQGLELRRKPSKEPVKSAVIQPLRLSEDDQATLRLAYRRLGASGLANPAVGQILQLSELQQESMASILMAQRKRVEKIVETVDSDGGSSSSSAMQTIRDANSVALTNILEPAQRAAWSAACAQPRTAGEPLL